MITEKTIRILIEEKLGQTSLFLTDLIIRQDHQINVYIDGDQGVTIDDCVMLSRYIESHLDRDKEDFALQVSSHGIDQPLKFARQYVKNVGRRFRIELKDGHSLTGKLISAEGEKIHLQTEKQKGNKTIQDEIVELNIGDIDKALCLISFK